MAEKGTEYEVVEQGELETVAEEEQEINIGRVTYETDTIESEETSITVGSKVRNYGVLDSDKELEI